MATPVTVSAAQLAQLAPRSLPDYRASFELAGDPLGRHGITRSALRLAHFMAQILHESGALTIQFENLRYSAGRLPQVWPTRFQPRGPLAPADYAFNEEKLANEVYGNRMGNRRPGDGFEYRGRGLLQLTGKESYAQASRVVRASVPDAPDFTAVPDATLAPAWCLEIAAAEWEAKGCNEAADRNDLVLVTRRINGGLVGLPQRRAWFVRTGALWDA